MDLKSMTYIHPNTEEKSVYVEKMFNKIAQKAAEISSSYKSPNS